MSSVAPRRTSSIFVDEQNPITISAVQANDTLHTNRSAGRPRSESARNAILDAVNKMLLHAPVRDLSIEAIAKKAGVGKTTIYRWWPNKVAIILDAIAPSLQFNTPTTVSGDNPKDLFVQHMERFARILKGRQGKVLAELFAESQGDNELLELFYKNFMVSHEEILANIITQGKQSDAFRPDLDTALAVDMIYGSMFYRIMSNPDGFDADFVNHVIVNGLRLLLR